MHKSMFLPNVITCDRSCMSTKGIRNLAVTNRWTGVDWTGVDWTGILKFAGTLES